jgi:ferritin
MNPLKELDTKLDDVIHKLERVTFLSDILKEKIDELENLETRVTKLENFQSYVKGIFVTASVVGAVILGFAVDMLKRLF